MNFQKYVFFTVVLLGLGCTVAQRDAQAMNKTVGSLKEAFANTAEGNVEYLDGLAKKIGNAEASKEIDRDFDKIMSTISLSVDKGDIAVQTAAIKCFKNLCDWGLGSSLSASRAGRMIELFDSKIGLIEHEMGGKLTPDESKFQNAVSSCLSVIGKIRAKKGA